MKQIDQHNLNLITGWLQSYANGEQLRSRDEHQQIMATLATLKTLPSAVPESKPKDEPPVFERNWFYGEVRIRLTREMLEDSNALLHHSNMIEKILTGEQQELVKPLWETFQQQPIVEPGDDVLSEKTLRNALELIGDGKPLYSTTHPHMTRVKGYCGND